MQQFTRSAIACLASLLVSESTTLALVGGAGGAALARVGLSPLLSALPLSIPRASEVALDTRVLMATLGASLAVGAVLGILPLLIAKQIVCIYFCSDLI